jgi:hypothetical protein
MGGAVAIQRSSESPDATHPVPGALSIWNQLYPSASKGPPRTTALASLRRIATVSEVVPGVSRTRTRSATIWIIVPMAYGELEASVGDGAIHADPSGTEGDGGTVGGRDAAADETDAETGGSTAVAPHPTVKLIMATTTPSLQGHPRT